MAEELRMSRKELSRVEVITNVLKGILRQTEASRLLKLCIRQINRIVKEARLVGIFEALKHKNRGRASNKKISDEIKDKTVSIYKKRYYDFGPKFATEKMIEEYKIVMSKETLRKILIEKQIPYPTRKRGSGVCHVWRQRKEYFGEMVQIDGSHHRWFEDRLDKEVCLLSFIDDATSTLYARFYEYEGIFPVLDCLMRFVKLYGIPHSIYSDKHSTYITTRQPSVEEMLQAKRAQTQVVKILNTLDIEHIPANSPQAKGRVERVAETLQDRLVKEMRLRNISSINNGNHFLDTYYLEKHNQLFSKQPALSTSLFKPVHHHFDYKWTFAIQNTRTINNNYTISWQNRLFLLLNRSITMKRKKILIKQSLEGDLQFSTKDKIISVKEITQKDIDAARKNRELLEKIAKEYCYKKSKKSWMDNYYIATNRSFYA